MLAGVDKKGGLCYPGKQLHFASRTQPVYIHPTGKEEFAGKGNDCTTNQVLPMRVPISSSYIHLQKANKRQHLKERVKGCFCRRVRKDDQAVRRSEIFAGHLYALRTIPQRQARLQLLSWASVETHLILSITAP